LPVSSSGKKFPRLNIAVRAPLANNPGEMRLRFEAIYRLGLASLLGLAVWSVWLSAKADPASKVPSGAPWVGVTNQNWATFGLDQIPILQNTLLGQGLWKYLASLIYIVLAFLIAWLLDYFVGAWLHRKAAKAKSPYDDLLANLLCGPVKVVAFIVFLNIGLGVFDWPARAQLLLSRGFMVVVGCAVTYVTIKVVDLLLGLWREKIVSIHDRVFAELLFPLLSKLAKVGIVIAAAMLTADNLGIKITSLLAGLSVGGLALGLAAQDTVANLFGAMAIITDKPFHLGDLIKVEGMDGTVESIGLRSTRIRNAEGHHITIPNKLMGNAVITNISRRPAIRTEMNLGLAYDTTVEKVRRATAILEEVFRSSPKTADLLVSFNKFTDSALNLCIIHVWKGVEVREHLGQMQDWNLQIKQRFESEQIELAFPTQTIHLKSAGK
jgi:MscS family membrane protein